MLAALGIIQFPWVVGWQHTSSAVGSGVQSDQVTLV